MVKASVQYISRDDLDIVKYNACVSSSINSRIYGTTHYLDLVTKNWDALVLNDYESVMPLPWRRKYYLYYIFPPLYTQQLGIFSKTKMDSNLVDLFLSSIPKKFVKTSMKLNSSCFGESFIQKSNFILNLQDDYQVIKGNYRKDRRYRRNQFERGELRVVEGVDVSDIIDLFKMEYQKKIELENVDFEILSLISKSKALNPEILKVYNSEGKIMSGAVLVKDNKRVYYIFAANNEEGRRSNANTGILDYVIRKYSNSNLTLDFEGSMIPAIQAYFKSFGSIEEKYFLYKSNGLNGLSEKLKSFLVSD